MEYQVENQYAKKPIVICRCPGCHAVLTCSLFDAGQEERCPDCRFELIVPGIRELEALTKHRKVIDDKREEDEAMQKLIDKKLLRNRRSLLKRLLRISRKFRRNTLKGNPREIRGSLLVDS